MLRVPPEPLSQDANKDALEVQSPRFLSKEETKPNTPEKF